jgi:hypothetical protein
MKRYFYIASFTFLGILLQLLAHGLIEVWYIGLLLSDFVSYGFGLSWNNWVLIHNILTILFFIAGTWIGYKEGVYWWRKIYEENATALWKERWKEKKIPVSWLIVAGIILMGFSAIWFNLENVGLLPVPGKGYICTEDAKLCPDGSYVGRSGPGCEFAACPDAVGIDTSTWKTYRNSQVGFELKYPANYVFDEDEADGSVSFCYDSCENDAPRTFLSVENNTKNLSLRQWWAANMDNQAGWIEKDEIKIDGMNALVFEERPMDYPIMYIVTEKAGRIILIGGGMSDEMIKSFKFIESN